MTGSGTISPDEQARRSLRRFAGVLSLLLASGGLLALFLYFFGAVRTQTIAGIHSLPAFRAVRVCGTVSGHPRRTDRGGLVWEIRDESGTVRVCTGAAQAEALREAGRLPCEGDRLRLRAVISPGPEPSLCLGSSRDLARRRVRAVPPEPGKACPLSQITAAARGRRFVVSGVLKSVEIPGPGDHGPYVLTLAEGGIEIGLILWEEVLQDLGWRLPVPGTRVLAEGEVEVRRGAVRLRICSPEHLVSEKPL